MSPRGHQRGAGGGGCAASPRRRPSGPPCAADISGLITPAPVVRAAEVRLRGPRVSFSWPAGQAEAARPLMGAQSKHPQEKQVLEGLSVAVAVAHPLHARVTHPPPQLSGSYLVSMVQWSLRQRSPLGHGDHASLQTNLPPKLEFACGEPPLWGPLCGLAGYSQSKGPRVSPGPLRSCRAVGVSLGPQKSGSRDSRVPIPCSSFSNSISMFYPLLFTYVFGYLFIQSIFQG